MSEENMIQDENIKKANDNVPNNSKGCRIGCLAFIIIIFLLAIIGGFNEEPTNTASQKNGISESSSADTKTQQPQKEVKRDPHVITKADFKGEWAFTTDSAEVYCVDLGNGITGTKVYINGRFYAATRNMEKLEFLPDNLWADKPMEGLLCEGAYMGGKICKVSLLDVTEYADTLCK